jgi:hypothetical protein
MTYTCSPDNKLEYVGLVPQSPSDSASQGRIRRHMFDGLSRFDDLKIAQQKCIELQLAE